MTTGSAELVSAPSGGTWKDFRYYLGWWCVWMGAAGLLTPVYGPGDDFWLVKTWQVVNGVIVGAVSAVIFTVLQNLANKGRNRVLSWVFAIAIWQGLKFFILLVLNPLLS